MTRLLRAVVEWCRNPRCPLCGERTPWIEAHIHVEHAGDS